MIADGFEVVGRVVSPEFVGPRLKREGYSTAVAIEVSIATNVRAVVGSTGDWEVWAEEADNLSPVFSWRSIALFNPRDPIIALRSDAVQAFMQLRERYRLRCMAETRGPIVYVAFLDVAPWNRGADRCYQGLGLLLLRFACQRSLQLGYEGRIGLHSLRDAEGFYRSLGFSSCGCTNEFRELYFELDATSARRFLKEG